MKKIEKEAEAAREDIIGDFMAGISPVVKLGIERKMEVAVAIADALERKGWSQKEFALRLGKRESEISKWLSGKQNFTLETLALIEDALGCPLIQVYGASEVAPSMETMIQPVVFRRMNFQPILLKWPVPTFSLGVSQKISIPQASLQPMNSHEDHLQPC